MTRRKMYWFLSWGGAVVGVLTLLWGLFFGVTFKFSQEEIQGLIDSQLKGINKNLEEKGKNLTIESLDVYVTNEITINAKAHGKKLGKDFHIALTTTTKEPDYVATKRSFYLNPENITVTEFGFSGNSVKDVVTSSAKRYITNEGLRRLMTDSAGKVESWAIKTAENFATNTLSRFPIYTLKNRNENELLVTTFLDKVYVHDGYVFAKLTLLRLAWWGFLSIFVILASVAFMFAIVQNPGLGLAVLTIGSLGD